MTEIYEIANAKVNLFLEVHGKRNDGYHEIETVMMPSGLADEVYIKRTAKGINVKCDTSECKKSSDLDVLSEKDNIAFSAASAFFGALHKKNTPHDGVTIEIKKKIPVKSGLAGGSADAAAVLRGLNTLYSCPFDELELSRIAYTLGADVPFCLFCKAALCCGIGEVIMPIDTEIKLHGVIVVGKEEKLSTGAAYSLVDIYNAKRGEKRISASDTVKALEQCDLIGLSKSLFNVFEEACDYEGRAKAIMLEEGCIGASLSGAGPSYFGLTDRESTALSTLSRLEEEGFTAYIL